MSVTAIKPYQFPAKDVRSNFPAPLLFINWDEHLMFPCPVALPLPADMPFAALTQTVLPKVYGVHPDFEHIDWSTTQWFKSGQPWTPDPAVSLEGNGLGHKDMISFVTPGLTGIAGSAS